MKILEWAFLGLILVGLVKLLCGCGGCKATVVEDIVKGGGDRVEEKVEKKEIPEMYDIRFTYDSFEIDDFESQKVFENTMLMGANGEYNLEIAGHCDERGSEEYNLNLGKLRANEVKQHYVYLGIDADRIRTISYGESQPLSMGHTEKDWELNRRVETKLKERKK